MTRCARPTALEDDPHVTAGQKTLWAVAMAMLAGVLYLAFRGYLSPAMLLDFSNLVTC